MNNQQTMNDNHKARIIDDLAGEYGEAGLNELMQQQVFQQMARRGGEYRLRKAMHRRWLEEKAARLNASGVSYLRRASYLLNNTTSTLSYVM